MPARLRPRRALASLLLAGLLVSLMSAGPGATSLFRLGAPGGAGVNFEDSTVTLRVPPGEYALISNIAEGPGGWSALLVQPRLTVDSDRSMTLDARGGRPVSVSLPEPSAELVFADFRVRVAQQPPEGAYFGVVDINRLDNLFIARLGPNQTVEGFEMALIGTWAERNASGTFTGTPYAYHLAWLVAGRMVTGLEREVKRRDLARVVADHGAQLAGTAAAKAANAVLPGWGDIGGARMLADEPPFRRIEYYNADGGVRWHPFFEEAVIGEFPELVGALGSAPVGTAYRPGHRYHERWNYGVFGPALPEPLPSEWAPVIRYADRLSIRPSLYGDGGGNADGVGQAAPTPAGGTIAVFRNGELIAEQPGLTADLEVPPEPADYRVEIEAERSGPSPLSTRTSLAWEFRSGRVDEETPVTLPVSVVRFSPRLGPLSTAPAARPFLVPVAVQPQPGSDAGPARNLNVSVSYDDGASWREALLLGNRYALLWHPPGDGFVSLRATATDRRGNSVEQTVVRAYRIG